MAYILLIIMAWIISMPFWLSLTTTIVSSIGIICKILSFVIKVNNYSDFGD